MDDSRNTQTYVRTPADLDAAARALDRQLAQTSSPQKRFLLISSFFLKVENLPPEWLQGYVLFLLPLLIDLVRLPFIRSIPPEHWAGALNLLSFARGQFWSDRFDHLDAALGEAANHATLSHAFVSSLRELHLLLKRHAVVESQVAEHEWARIFGPTRTAFDVFATYVGILESHGEYCADWMSTLLSQWSLFRTRQDAVSVVMLEEDNFEHHDIGRVLLMDIHSSANGGGETHLGNILGQKGTGTLEQLQQAQRHAERLVAAALMVRVPRFEFTFSLHEGSAEIVGESLGLAAAAGVASMLTQKLNRSERWTLPTIVSCIGSLDAQGAVEDPGWGILNNKIKTAFFSPLEAIAVPAVHREAGLHAVQRLQRQYPNRSLNIIGVTGLQDLLNAPGLIEVLRRSRYDRAREYATKHSVVLLLALIVFLLIVGGYFAYRAYIDYPNLEHSLGLNVGGNAIVYNPKDTVEWCLRDHDRIHRPIVDFGDIEVGDGFTRNFWLWNMTPRPLDVQVSIEGSDAGQWFVNYRYGAQVVDAAGKMQISVMFAPRHARQSERADLVFRDASGLQRLFSVELRGTAGPPAKAGYALRLDGKDDYILFGKRSSAFDVTEGTFECWLKPLDSARSMILHNGIATQAEPSTDDLWFGLLSPASIYIRVGSEIGLVDVPEKHALLPGKWSHLALAYSLPQRRIAVYVNGVLLEDRRSDFIFEGPGSAYVTIGAQNNTRNQEAFFNGEMDEVRFWSVFRTASEIKRTMHTTVPGLSPGLSGYWDMDATVEHTVFNANLRAHSGSLRTRASVVRSTAPLMHGASHCAVVPGPTGRTALQLNAGRYLACARWPLPRHSDATFAFWFYQSGAPAIHFSYVNGEQGWIAIEDTAMYTSVAKHWFASKPTPGWHHAVCTVTSEGATTLFIDGMLFDSNRVVTSGLHDWHQRFEGLQLGFRFDKQQQLSAKYYNWYHPTLNHPRAYADLHIWNRIISPAEIQALHRLNIVPRPGLTASWVLNGLPDSNLNYIDAINGLMLHVKQVRSWE